MIRFTEDKAPVAKRAVTRAVTENPSVTEISGVTKKRGRPKAERSMTDAERARAYRERKGKR